MVFVVDNPAIHLPSSAKRHHAYLGSSGRIGWPRRQRKVALRPARSGTTSPAAQRRGPGPR